jgi:hypothetical protein
MILGVVFKIVGVAAQRPFVGGRTVSALAEGMRATDSNTVEAINAPAVARTAGKPMTAPLRSFIWPEYSDSEYSDSLSHTNLAVHAILSGRVDFGMCRSSYR